MGQWVNSVLCISEFKDKVSAYLHKTTLYTFTQGAIGMINWQIIFSTDHAHICTKYDH